MSPRQLVLLIIVYWLSIAAVQASSLVRLNSVTENENGLYVIGNNDPYFVFDLKDIEINSAIEHNKYYWQLPITLKSKAAKNKTIELEVFFDGQTTNDRLAFSPRKHLKFNIDAKQWSVNNGINLPIPDSVRFANNSLLRLDLNGCSNCIVSFNGEPSINANRQAGFVNAKLEKHRNGVTELEQSAVVIPLQKWQRNHIDVEGKVIGVDPFLISPLLDTSTDNLAGIYIEAVTQEQDLDRALFQVFYATETHGFIEAASIYSQVNVTKTNVNIEQTFRFYLPLDFLYQQSPRKEILERIRIDFSNHYSAWSLNKVELIPASKKGQYMAFLPKLLVQAKLQKPSTRQIIKDIVSRLSRDLSFAFVYLLLLLGTSWFFWRSYNIGRGSKR